MNVRSVLAGVAGIIMKEFNLHILEADSAFYEGPCVSLVVPMPDGLYGVLANHINMVAAVSIGDLKYTTPDGDEHFVSVSNGMLRIEDNDVLVLVESAEDPDEIDYDRAMLEMQEAEELLKSEMGRINYKMASAMVARAMNRLRTKSRYGRDSK